MSARRWRFAASWFAALVAAPLAAQAPVESTPSRSRNLPAEALDWQQQTPNLPIMISLLWGDRQADGGFGEMVRLPPGFDSGRHAHSADFHGVLIEGTWVHEGPAGQGRDTRLGRGSYVRQAGGEMHVDRCVSDVPCVLFLFQYARADIIWPDARGSTR